MSTLFINIFKKVDDPSRIRAKFLSRLFGIFSERIVSVWANDMRAPFENLGRPTLRSQVDPRGSTLDFTFKHRATGKVYVAEMKCEIEYSGFRYFVLEESHQLDHHKKAAFETFLFSAKHPNEVSVFVKKRPIKIDGAILVWGAVNVDAKGKIILQREFHDILSIEDISRDLADWQNLEYLSMIEEYRLWSTELFDGLLSKGSIFFGGTNS